MVRAALLSDLIGDPTFIFSPHLGEFTYREQAKPKLGLGTL
jgi:hypothetical protein